MIELKIDLISIEKNVTGRTEHTKRKEATTSMQSRRPENPNHRGQ